MKKSDTDQASPLKGLLGKSHKVFVSKSWVFCTVSSRVKAIRFSPIKSSYRAFTRGNRGYLKQVILNDFSRFANNRQN
jgi:hypothetical protein